MRANRSLLILLAISFAAAGCALQPVMRVPVAAAPAVVVPPMLASAGAARARVAAPGVAVSGIDTTVYGSVGTAMPVAAATPAPLPGRGLMLAYPATSLAMAPVNGSADAPALREGSYTLDSGDRLRIVVFGQDGLSNSYLVDASGYIDMPLIGSVLARGETTGQLSSRIGDRLRQGYIRDPHVAVEVEAYRPFFILGEVTQPGQYPYVADMTAETAVAIAGGFGPRAFRKTVSVTRAVNGQVMHLTVPLSYPLRPGDTVNVQERWF